MTKQSEISSKLRWRFDVNTFRLIGRELITDRITAVYELVKNCYDANATEVYVNFEHQVSSGELKTSKITISDNGCGMSFNDIRDKWMVVGTASKRGEKYSPAPFNRRYVGEKGIGRFAVDKLGGHLVISTKQHGEERWLKVSIDWNLYEELSKSDQLELFTDVDNLYTYSTGVIDEHGTSLVISSIADDWTETDLLRLEHELEKIVSPFHRLVPKFEIYLRAPTIPGYKKKKVRAQKIKYSSDHFSIGYDKSSKKQESLCFSESTGLIEIVEVDFKSFGPIKFQLFYFDRGSKTKFNKAYKGKEYYIDGIKIYRDGLITTPFAEFESSPDKKRDILGVDKRRWSHAFDKIGSKEIIGIVDITKENNPKIIDSTNRQDFVDNKEIRDLKDFLIEQLDSLGSRRIYEREKIKQNTDIALERANLDIEIFSSTIENIAANHPSLARALKPLKKQAKEIDTSLKKGIRQQKEEREEYVRKENIYLSLMSLQDYAIHISHAVRTALGKVKRMAEFFNKRFPDPKYDDLFKNYAAKIYEEMNNLNRIIDFMLSYAGSNVAMQDFSVKSLLEKLINESYEPVFEAEGITAEININEDFHLHANKKFFEDIFENLISNSTKALRNTIDKKIKCSGHIIDDNFVLYFSDNGCGVDDEYKDKIFDMYYTRTADLGGAGIGLYIVKTRIESLKGTIELDASEFLETGATFKITFPFKPVHHES